MNWYLLAFKNYANFSGRARRKEYWMFILFHYLIILLLYILIITFSINLGDTSEMAIPEIILSILLLLYFLATIIPYLAITVRRLHDINKSGGYWFVRFIPLVGPIWLLILLVEDSWDGVNRYGPNPKGFYNDDEINKIGME
mgnify:CR=1 FL=1